MYQEYFSISIPANKMCVGGGDPDHETAGRRVEYNPGAESGKRFPQPKQVSRSNKRDMLLQRLAGLAFIAAGIMCAALDPAEGGTGLVLLGSFGVYSLITKRQLFYF